MPRDLTKPASAMPAAPSVRAVAVQCGLLWLAGMGVLACIENWLRIAGHMPDTVYGRVVDIVCCAVGLWAALRIGGRPDGARG